MECSYCSISTVPIARNLGVCGNCIRDRPEEVLPPIMRVHATSRLQFGLPTHPPRHANGVKCPLCVNQCQIPPQELGYCGLRTNRNGKLVHLADTARRTSDDGRICWETNGTMHSRLLHEAIELSLDSGSCIKFDLKPSMRTYTSP